MPELESLQDLKVEALVAAMKYTMRDDFASHRQNLIDSVRREVGRTLRAADKSGVIEEKVDEDGDIAFTYERSGFHFRLDSRPRVSGAQFKDLYEHGLALTILKVFLTQVIHVLGLRDLDVLMVDFSNVLNLARTAPKNFQIIKERIMPRMSEGLSPLVTAESEIARVDFKVGWDYDARRTCYCTIECPGNEENSTVWTMLNVRTREDIEVTIDQSKLITDIEKAYEIYCGPYNDALRCFFGDTELDFTRRLLQRS